MLGGWFGHQALKKFLGAIDFTAPGASGWTKNAYKLSFTLVCPQDLISGHLDRFIKDRVSTGPHCRVTATWAAGRYKKIGKAE
jgi:hypothetical protein